MYRQFGVHPSKASDKRTVHAFRTKVLRELKKIKLAWPELNYSTAPGVLILHPSTPVIAAQWIKASTTKLEPLSSALGGPSRPRRAVP